LAQSSVQSLQAAQGTHAPRLNLCPAASDDRRTSDDQWPQSAWRRRADIRRAPREPPRRGAIRPTRERSERSGQAGRRPWASPTGSATSWPERFRA